MQTTIRIDMETRDVLEKLKIIPHEPYEHVIRRMLIALSDDEGTLNETTVRTLRSRMLQLDKAITSSEMMRRVQQNVDAGSSKGLHKRSAISKSR